MLDVEEFVLLFQEFFFLVGVVEFAFHVFVSIFHDVDNFWRQH